MAKVHSERGDVRGGRLEKRFGHPALHAELFTPMLHAKMMHLLPQVYQGRIGQESFGMGEFGGQKMETSVVPGGIKIAAVQQVSHFMKSMRRMALNHLLQSELEYDPALYQRDRGELDWDQRSIASTTILNDAPPSLSHQKSQYYAGSPGGSVAGKPRGPAGYNNYLAHGTTHEIEMSRLDTKLDELPLLADSRGYHMSPSSRAGTPTPPAMSNVSLPAYNVGYYSDNGSVSSLPRYPPGFPPQQESYPPQAPPQTQQSYFGEREASLHRPSPPSRQQTGTPRSDSPPNMAGRGAHRY